MWRSAVPGADLLALVIPNPRHPLLRPLVRPWLEDRPGGFIENVVSVSIVALAVILVARWRSTLRFPTLWLAITLGFALLALGPFLTIGGLNTHIPLPWFFLGHVPLLGAASTPTRFAAVMMLGMTALFGLALASLADSAGPRARVLVGAVDGGARGRTAARAPDTPRGGRARRLHGHSGRPPAGVGAAPAVRVPGRHEDRRGPMTMRGRTTRPDTASDSSAGTFSPDAQPGEPAAPIQFEDPDSAERGCPVHAPAPQVLRGRGAAFARRARLGYVVVDRARASSALVDYAVSSFALERIGGDEVYDLYPAPCRSALRRRVVNCQPSRTPVE